MPYCGKVDATDGVPEKSTYACITYSTFIALKRAATGASIRIVIIKFECTTGSKNALVYPITDTTLMYYCKGNLMSVYIMGAVD